MAVPVLAAPHVDLLGVEFVAFDAASETITLSFTAPASFITPRGGVQGGLVAGFLDEAMGWAHVWATDGAEAPLNLDITMTLLRLVPEGKLTVNPELKSLGVEVRIRNLLDSTPVSCV